MSRSVKESRGYDYKIDVGECKYESGRVRKAKTDHLM